MDYDENYKQWLQSEHQFDREALKESEEEVSVHNGTVTNVKIGHIPIGASVGALSDRFFL
jgi:hypothetical protein